VTRVKSLLALLAVGVLLVVVIATFGPPGMRGSDDFELPAKPKNLDKTGGRDGSAQVIIQLWHDPKLIPASTKLRSTPLPKVVYTIGPVVGRVRTGLPSFDKPMQINGYARQGDPVDFHFSCGQACTELRQTANTFWAIWANGVIRWRGWSNLPEFSITRNV
jgi:hypothetical protein